MKISFIDVYSVLKRLGLNRLPRNTKKRTVTTNGIKNKFLVTIFKSMSNSFLLQIMKARKSNTSLRVYNRHTQKNAIKFIDHIVEHFPFRTHTVRTDNGHNQGVPRGLLMVDLFLFIFTIFLMTLFL